MLKLFNRKNDRDKEEEKKEEAIAQVTGVAPLGKNKKSPGELRLKKEIAELDLPSHAQVHFPDETNIMRFELVVDLTKEQCLW